MYKNTENQETECDVVIVGYGGAGAISAITSHDNGAKVIILEKMPDGGGNTRLSAGGFLTPTGIEAIEYIQISCYGKTDREIIRAFVEESMNNKDWIEQMGGRTAVHRITGVFYPYPHVPAWPNIPGAGAMSQAHSIVLEKEDKYPGERLWRFLSDHVKSRGIRVMNSTQGKELVTNENGEVVGVIAESAGKKVSIKAKRAVILTCGGFEYNDVMKAAFLPVTPLYPRGSPGNTGDGIIMTQKVGASLWHMNVLQGYLGFKAPDHKGAFPIRFYSPGFIYVSSDGWRFTNETGWESHEVWRAVTFFDPDRPCYPHLPAYGIFDEVNRCKGPIRSSTTTGLERIYEWSSDNSEEITKGWISQGKTMRELAKRISVDEKILEDTVNKYNEYCKIGKDADFGRPKETLEPISTAPYYAIELWPVLLNTQGGPRRDYKARVLDNEGKPIPRLYSAGELGSLWGFLYSGPGNITECLAFGRIAGRNAASEEPWC